MLLSTEDNDSDNKKYFLNVKMLLSLYMIMLLLREIAIEFKLISAEYTTEIFSFR